MKAQTSLFDEITVDGFCGGGWSVGFELALGRPVDIGINHDAAAIALHKANHPYTTHYQTSIFEVDPKEACASRAVGASCTSVLCSWTSSSVSSTVFFNPDDLVLAPFGGLMTVPYMAVKMGRRGAGIELNPDCFRDGVGYLQQADAQQTAVTLFVLLEEE